MFSHHVLKLICIFLVACYPNDAKKRKKEQPKMSFLFNSSVHEELYNVKQKVSMVKQDLYDIMGDVKGLNKILKTAENRIADIERRLNIVAATKTDKPRSKSQFKAVTEKEPKDLKDEMKPTGSRGDNIRQGSPPKFLDKTVLPEEVSVEVDHTATLDCPATGDPKPRIMWLKDQRLFARKPGTTATKSWKLFLRNVVPEDRGNYTCFLENQFGRIQHTVLLDVTDLTTPKTTATPSPTSTRRRNPKMKPTQSSPRSPTSKPKMKAKHPRMLKGPKVARPPNLMGKDPQEVWAIPSSIREPRVTARGEKCEAKVAAHGRPPSRDCWDLKMYHCVDKSGVYNITVDRKNYTVYCDMATDGGGWTVFQRRFNGKLNFNRNWADYKKGFGRMVDGEFWWGNENLYAFTRDRRMRVRIDMADPMNSTFVEYDGFWISRESDYYRLNVEGFRGLGGEALLQPVWKEESHNSMMFSTKDNDRDGSLANCAAHFGGGWWFNDCYSANLNGVYPRENTKKTPSLQWKPWKGPKKYLTRVEMKIRPAVAPSSVTWDFWYPETEDSFLLHEYSRIHGGCC